jgi:hypothetical protein
MQETLHYTHLQVNQLQKELSFLRRYLLKSAATYQKTASLNEVPFSVLIVETSEEKKNIVPFSASAETSVLEEHHLAHWSVRYRYVCLPLDPKISSAQKDAKLSVGL